MDQQRSYLAVPPYGLAHRGGWAPGSAVDSPEAENTLAAFEAAVAAGIDHIETDVHATADGVLVAFHDDRLDRVTDSSGAVADLTWAQVSRARIAGRYPIPTLDEVLAALPTARVNIDIKAPRAVSPLVALLAAAGAQQRVCVGSFSPRRLWAFRREARAAGLQVATSAGPIGTAALRLLPLGAWRLLRTPGIAYQVPVRHRAAGIDVEVVTPAFVARAHALGKQVHVWTINDAAEMRRLFALGVDAVVSDRLDLLREVLDDAGAQPT